MKFNREALFQKKRVLYPVLGSVVKKKNCSRRKLNLQPLGSWLRIVIASLAGSYYGLSQALLGCVTVTGPAESYYYDRSCYPGRIGMPTVVVDPDRKPLLEP